MRLLIGQQNLGDALEESVCHFSWFRDNVGKKGIGTNGAFNGLVKVNWGSELSCSINPNLHRRSSNTERIAVPNDNIGIESRLDFAQTLAHAQFLSWRSRNT